MKKLVSIIAAALCCTALFAQNQGDAYVSGAISLSSTSGSSKTDGIKSSTSSTSFSIGPEVGYFFKDNMLVKVAMDYKTDKTPNLTEGYTVENNFTITPGVSYFFNVKDNFYYTPGARMGIGFGNKSFDWELDLDALCFEYRGWEHFALCFNMGGVSIKAGTNKDNGSKTTYSNIGINLGLATTVGFKYYL